MRPAGCFLLIFFFLTTFSFAAVRDGHVTADLAAEAPEAGRAFRLEVRLAPEPGWHVYAKDPGDAGLATTVEFSADGAAPEGELVWPAAKTFVDGTITTYGYDEPFALTQRFRILPAAAGAVAVRAEVEWLACREACVPGKASLRIDVPVPTNPKEEKR